MIGRSLCVAVLTLLLAGCTNLQRLAHSFSDKALAPHSFSYADGGKSLYYSFDVGGVPQPDTFIFFYGGSGCPSWKYVMPGYVDGLSVPARVFALNKRFASDRSTSLFGCDRDFHLANSPDQWIADQSAFVEAQLRSAAHKPRNVVLVGISEGAFVAVAVARRLPAVTHLALIGDGGYSMRESLATLHRKGVIGFDVEAGWKAIAADPRSIDSSWFGNPYRWWSDVMDIDPMPEFLALRIPILLGMGEQDESVPVESARFLASRFEAVGKGNLTLEVYPGANHVLYGNGVSYRPAFFAELSCLLKAGASPTSCGNAPTLRRDDAVRAEASPLPTMAIPLPKETR